MNKHFAWTLLLAGVWLAGVPVAGAKEDKTGKTAAKSTLSATLSEKIGGPAAASFKASQPELYLNYQDAALPKGEPLRVVWIIEDGGATVSPNAKVAESAQAAVGPRSKGGYFHLTKPAAGWPLGKYRVELFDKDTRVQTLKFTIK